MVDIVWLIYFTSEEGSLALHMFNITGTGGLTGPGRSNFRSARRSDSRLNPQGVSMGNGGYGASGGGIGNGLYSSPLPDMGTSMRYDTKEGDMGMVGGSAMGMGNSYGPTAREGGNNPPTASLRTSEAAASVTSSTQPMSAPQPVAGGGGGGGVGGGDAVNPTTPLMDPTSNADGDNGSHQYRAKALYNCKPLNWTIEYC